MRFIAGGIAIVAATVSMMLASPAAWATASVSQPSISSFAPAAGPVGTVVTINGTNLIGLTDAWVGNGHDAAIANISSTRARITVPADATTGQIALGNGEYWAFSGSSFTVKKLPTPTATLAATPSTIALGSHATLSWSSTRATTCALDGNQLGAISGSVTVTPKAAGSYPYHLACTGKGGSAKASATLVVNASGKLAVSVLGNHLIDGNGNALQLRGANMSGLEFIGVQGGDVSTWDGTIPDWSLFQNWKANAVRIPLNAASWLGLTTYTANGQPATSFGSAVNADPQGDYKQTVISAVAAAQAAGFYVILDLHWSAPQITLNGSTRYITPNGQPEFMNASTDIAFWQSIAQTFGTQAAPQPGISNSGILFELFNEPYLDDYASGSTLYGLMLNGGTVSTFHWAIGAYSVSPAGGVAIAGYQQVLSSIRSLGARNVCIVNGPSWTQEAENYKQWFPTDTLSPPQLAAGWHPYPDGSYPYSNGDVYGRVGSDQGAGTASFAQWFEAILANGTPVIITEDGGEGGTDATSGEPHMSYMMNWADQNGASYLAWEWTEPQASGIAQTNNFMTVLGTDNAILPIQGEGVVVQNWFVSH